MWSGCLSVCVTGCRAVGSVESIQPSLRKYQQSMFAWSNITSTTGRTHTHRHMHSHTNAFISHTLFSWMFLTLFVSALVALFCLLLFYFHLYVQYSYVCFHMFMYKVLQSSVVSSWLLQVQLPWKWKEQSVLSHSSVCFRHKHSNHPIASELVRQWHNHSVPLLSFRVASMIAQFNEGLNSCGGLWDTVRSHWEVFVPVMTSAKQQPLSLEEFKQLFTICYSRPDSRLRAAEEVTARHWEAALTLVSGKNGGMDGGWQ